MSFDLNISLAATAVIRVALCGIVCVYAYQRRRPLAVLGFGLLGATSLVFGYQRAGAHVSPLIVNAGDKVATLALALVVLAYLRTNPRQHDRWRI